MLPRVVFKSSYFLHLLDSDHQAPLIEQKASKEVSSQLCFLDDVKAEEIPTYLKRLEDELTKVDVMKMTPFDALIKLN